MITFFISLNKFHPDSDRDKSQINSKSQIPTDQPRILRVSNPNCGGLSCSALLSKIGSFNSSSENKLLTAFRKVFLRWLNAVFTNRKNFSSLIIEGTSLFGVSLITALFTFGGGLNACSLTSNKYSVLKKACVST